MLLPRGVANRKQRQLTAYNALVTPLADSCPCPCPCPCPCLAAPAPVPVSMCMLLLVTATRDCDCDCDCERGTHPPLAALNVAVTVTGREGGRGQWLRQEGVSIIFNAFIESLSLSCMGIFLFFGAATGNAAYCVRVRVHVRACPCMCVRVCFVRLRVLCCALSSSLDFAFG